MLHEFVYAFAVTTGNTLNENQGEQGASLVKATVNSFGGTMAGSPISGGHGTIVLDVVQPAAPDGSRVFKVTESRFNSGKPFLCAAYGQTGNVVCDADASPPTEVLILLRVAGAGFYAPSRQQWHEESPGRNFSETADFSVTKASGADLTIAMKRSGVQQQPPVRTEIDGTVVYDTSQQMPDSINAAMTIAQGGSPTANAHFDISLQH